MQHDSCAISVIIDKYRYRPLGESVELNHFTEKSPMSIAKRSNVKEVPLTYISLFSSAGVGCYGFKMAGFECVATCELLPRRIEIQKYNHKCRYESGYICGDMTTDETKELIDKEFSLWQKKHKVKELDVLIATPPCQGMSYANHKKTNKEREMRRNSLVVESLVMTKRLHPRFFVYENVKAFLTTACLDTDGNYKAIKDAIAQNLDGEYNVLYRVVNFKDYGCPSSRTRTLVIGVRKDILDITPYDIFPDRHEEQTLRETIGHLPSLTHMGEIWDKDLYHAFRKYDAKMLPWIEKIKEGQGAFDNEDPARRPYHVVDGVRVPNVEKNGDKYTRQYWDKVAPCIHTRNDILASQNTVHPVDNRVLSIRELMLMMSIPSSFEWYSIPFKQLNDLPLVEKEKYLKKQGINIRQNIGEAVPTTIFYQIAKKIAFLSNHIIDGMEILNVIKQEKLNDSQAILSYIENNKNLGFVNLSKIAEYANAMREDNEAFYTRQSICYTVVKNLPEANKYKALHILEPSVGVGNFLPCLIEKYRDVPQVTIDICDIDAVSICIVRELLALLDVPANIRINCIVADSLLYDFPSHYDIVVGNPPYKKLAGKQALLKQYKERTENKETNNLFSFFIEMALRSADVAALIVPKSLISAPEFNETRHVLEKYKIARIIDYGEKAFRGVKIETVAFVVNTKEKPENTKVESYITNQVVEHEQVYLTDHRFPYWLIYRNKDFDSVADKMEFGIFSAYRDRSITKKHTQSCGTIRVLKSRNIGNNEILNIDGYDCYVDDADHFGVAEYMNRQDCVLVPNLTYYPRACFMPRNSICDGSVAILTQKNSSIKITKEDLAYYGTEEFSAFYKIARNMGTRSLNIDNNSVFFFGKKVR